MAEYIDRDALLGKIWEAHGDFTSGDVQYGLLVAEKEVENLPAIDPVEAAVGCYCLECKYQEDCDCWVTQSSRDSVLEHTVYKHRKLEWCSYGEKEDRDEKL